MKKSIIISIVLIIVLLVVLNRKKKGDSIALGEIIKPVGNGIFGPIYDQFKDKPKEAVEWLMEIKNGECPCALYHIQIGYIDLVWGFEGTGKSDGFGLSKIVKYHPEVVDKLQEILDETRILKSNDRGIKLQSKKYHVGIRLTWNETKKTWLMTMFEKDTV